MRQIILDTETTGIGVEYGHRLIEIGCMELVDRQLTGRVFHTYLNPMRKVDPGAFKVHGLSDAFLADKPLFKDIVEDLLTFLGDAELIIHNAVFDIGFLNAELERLKYKTTIDATRSVLDTLVLAREKHPGQRNNLDALCKRYDVTHFNRTYHGALLDAEILAHVYLAMTGGQIHLCLEEERSPTLTTLSHETTAIPRLSSHSPVYVASEEELARHRAWVEKASEASGVNYWTRIVQ